MREVPLLSLVVLPQFADAMPLVPTAARTASTTLSPLALNSSTLTTNLTSPTPNLLLTLDHSPHGRIPRKSSLWILLVTSPHGCSRI